MKFHCRFVYLENCGHIIHREAMDKWMSQKDEKSGSTQITIKRCPKCSATITNCVRYGNIIKKQFQDVLGIRKKIFGNNQSQQQLRIAQKIQRQANQECQFEYIREFLEKRIFVMKQIRMKLNYRMDLQLLDVSGGFVMLNCPENHLIGYVFPN